MSEYEPLLERVKQLKPYRVLDIGCGCGSFTSQLAPHCGQITAIEVSEQLVQRCRSGNDHPNVDYRCMDARELKFDADSFDLVVVRATLHHIFEWQKALDEIIRVSRSEVLIEEPLDDPRSDAKRRTMKAQELFLALQAEVGYPLFKYVTPELLSARLCDRGMRFAVEIVRSDKLVAFDYFFEPWEHFASQSRRRDYWPARLAEFRAEMAEDQLCETDTVFVSARK